MFFCPFLGATWVTRDFRMGFFSGSFHQVLKILFTKPFTHPPFSIVFFLILLMYSPPKSRRNLNQPGIFPDFLIIS